MPLKGMTCSQLSAQELMRLELTACRVCSLQHCSSTTSTSPHLCVGIMTTALHEQIEVPHTGETFRIKVCLVDTQRLQPSNRWVWPLEGLYRLLRQYSGMLRCCATWYRKGLCHVSKRIEYPVPNSLNVSGPLERVEAS